MQNNRRKFILGTGLAAGGVALSGLSLLASEPSAAKAERVAAGQAGEPPQSA